MLNLFVEYLDKGYTYQDIKTEIYQCFYDKRQTFRWNRFKNPKANGNLIKQGIKYCHKELKLIAKPPIVDYDVDRGTMVSRGEDYFLEQVASYTLQDFIKYFYNNIPVDLQAQPPNKMTGMFRYKIQQYGIDKLLFMTDIMKEDLEDKNKIFNLGEWDNYSYQADTLMNDFLSNFSENEKYYIPKQRRLFE